MCCLSFELQMEDRYSCTTESFRMAHQLTYRPSRCPDLFANLCTIAYTVESPGTIQSLSYLFDEALTFRHPCNLVLNAGSLYHELRRMCCDSFHGQVRLDYIVREVLSLLSKVMHVWSRRQAIGTVEARLALSSMHISLRKNSTISPQRYQQTILSSMQNNRFSVGDNHCLAKVEVIIMARGLDPAVVEPQMHQITPRYAKVYTRMMA